MKYQEIEKFIIDNIESGSYKADDMIPSENQLAAKFKTSRMTARRAINNLVSKNFLYQQMGKGTFVLDNSSKIEIYLGKTVDFAERSTKAGREPKTKNLFFEKIKAPFNVAGKLDIETKEDVYSIERLRYLDGEPAIFEITFLPYKIYDNLSEIEIEILKFEYAKKLKDRKIIRQLKEFTAVLPELKVQDALRISERMPVLQLEVISFLETGEICEYSRVYYNQNRFKFMQDVGI